MFKRYMYDIPQLPKEGVCLRCMMSRNRQNTGVFKIHDATDSPNEGACLRYMVNRNRQMRERF